MIFCLLDLHMHPIGNNHPSSPSPNPHSFQSIFLSIFTWLLGRYCSLCHGCRWYRLVCWFHPGTLILHSCSQSTLMHIPQMLADLHAVFTMVCSGFYLFGATQWCSWWSHCLIMSESNSWPRPLPMWNLHFLLVTSCAFSYILKSCRLED